jgi:hypothetical protein
MKIKEIKDKIENDLEKINEISNRKFIELTKWLYNNHLEILREWEKTQGKVRVEFL